MWVCVVYLENEPRNGFRESREEGQGRNVGSPTHVMEQVAAVGTQGAAHSHAGSVTPFLLCLAPGQRQSQAGPQCLCSVRHD